MATKLPVLPEELLQRIVSNFETSCEGRTYNVHQNILRSLTRVNRQFHRLAQPLLYRSLVTRWPHHRQWDLRLLRTLLEQSELADSVQDVWMMPDVVLERDQRITASEEVDADLFSAAIKRTEEIGTRDFLSDQLLASALKSGNEDACTALLLLIAPNITFLHLRIPYDWEDSFVGELMNGLAKAAPDAKPAVLKSLKTLEVEHWDTENSTDIERLSDLLRSIPSLKILRGHQLSVRGSLQGHFGSWLSNLKEIHLTYSAVDDDGLDGLLRYCSSLQHLSIEWGNYSVGECEIRWPQIGDVLRQYGKSLKTLKLDGSEVEAWDREYSEQPFLPLGDLRPLTRLEKLAVHWIYLVGEESEGLHVPPADLASILPESLKELELSNDYEVYEADEDEWFGPKLEGLKNDKRFKGLKIMRLE